MKQWFLGLSVMEHIYLWLGIISTLFMIVQIIMMCVSSFGGDIDIDGDGEIDVDTDSGVSIFTVKSITAFFAVGSWSGLLTCALVSAKLQWLSLIVAFVAGGAAMALMVVLLRAIVKLQCNGAFNIDKTVGKKATVYVSIPPSRSGRGKITMNAQGRFVEIDAVTDEDEKLSVDEEVEIISTENECALVRKVKIEHTDEPPESDTQNEQKTDEKSAKIEEN